MFIVKNKAGEIQAHIKRDGSKEIRIFETLEDAKSFFCDHLIPGAPTYIRSENPLEIFIDQWNKLGPENNRLVIEKMDE